ncbi:regulator of G-protein signaling 14 isoform X1 [Scleropages formosus]|uniref:regulator of G-protein signaling 14 isoform X1 n=2 Tax=Scleropages formosus TaxID=113540 RepID=UPI0010FA99FC|nr:regulator of G-protein signaling 14 isoform X1 [Scleropages formosus]
MQLLHRFHCQELSKGFCALASQASLRFKCWSRNLFNLSPNSHAKQGLAVSDGELNMAEPEGRGSSHSLNSNSCLSGVQRSNSGVGKVASWAVSFERLLEDPTGVHYFTAFLKSEVSAENILFWQACEKFRKIPANKKEELIKEARSIYDAYLSSSASHAINIDDTARTNECDLEDPNPEMFSKAQQQIFKLMKFDSYARFVRSPLYQSCMLADVEGRPLPGSKSPVPPKGSTGDSQSPTDGKKQKKKVKPGKSFPFDVEDGSDRKKGTPEGKSARDKRQEKRGSWGAELTEHSKNMCRYESQCSVRSTGSMELSSSYSRTENGSSSPREREPGRAERYCCVFLPDGTASLAPARPGQAVREMLSGLCEKRGFSLNDVVIYLQGKEKPLSLDQDSSVLRDQQVSLELRVKFTLEVAFTGKAVGIMAKSSKTLQESLSAVLQKHNLRPQDAVITMNGKKEPLNMSMNVFSLANKKLQLDRANGPDHSNIYKSRVRTAVFQERPPGTVETCDAIPPLASTITINCRTTNTAAMKNCDMDGLIDLLSRAQCQVDDQRGLLTKEQLVIPDFLQLPQDKSDGGEPEAEADPNLPPPIKQVSGEEPPTTPTIKVTPPGLESFAEPGSADSADGAVCVGAELQMGTDTPTSLSTTPAGSPSTRPNVARETMV